MAQEPTELLATAQAPDAEWTAGDSADLYGIERWGNDYFGVSPDGCVTARTLNSEIQLLDVVKGMQERGLQMPALLRIENILDAQLVRLNEAFKSAIDSLGYRGRYQGVYPVKVNQQAQIVEEIAAFGERYGHGLEVGSKPELIVAMATLNTGSLIVCNGYKDQEFIDLGLQATQLGFKCFFVIETLTELPIVIERSRALSVAPLIGVRVKSTAGVSGHWQGTSGDRSMFGLTATQIVEVVDALREAEMLDRLQLLHCHLGSQIPDIRDIRGGIMEACRFYVDLIREGASLAYIDLGGGLAIDYTGWSTAHDQSRNYRLDEYCEDVVDVLTRVFDEQGIEHPTIVTESGRATVAYSSVLLFNVLDVTQFDTARIPQAPDNEHPSIGRLREIYAYLSPERVQECLNDANYYRNEIRELYRYGQLDLRQLSIAESLYLDLAHRIGSMVADMDDDEVPADLDQFKQPLEDIYYVNFSLFQSLPDVWAIDQLFPIMPIHRLGTQPDRQAVLADITCDCDGKIDSFIGKSARTKTLPVHRWQPGDEYYIGIFLVGAYQETLGDLHNLFGDTNVVSIRILKDGEFEFVRELHGDTIGEVLSYVEYDPKELQRRYRNTAEQAVRNGLITARQRQHIINTFNDCIQGYTYHEQAG